MIVPFLFTLYDYKEEYTLLDVYFKMIGFCNKYKMPFIVQEKFTSHSISYYRDEKKLSATTEGWEIIQDYKVPTDEEVAKVNKLIIPESLEKKLLKHYGNLETAIQALLSKRISFFEKEIEKLLIELEKEEKIEALFTWVYYPSLQYLCTKYHIQLIQMEMGPIRYFNYSERLGYFCFHNKYDSSSIEKEYCNFLKIKDKLILNREEILSLFLREGKLYTIRYLYQIPQYEVGYALGLPNDQYEKRYSFFDNQQVFKKLNELVPSNQVLIRNHPAYKNKNWNVSFDMDTSDSSYEWLSKCRNIVCSTSNISFEAMLYGRSITSISNSIASSFGQSYDLSYLNEEIVSLDRLNFLFFYYFVPYDLIYDLKYIRWRLANPSIEEIYNKNLECILKKRGLSIALLKKIEPKTRLKTILDKTTSLSELEKEKILSYRYNYYSTKDEEIESLKQQLADLKNRKCIRYLDKLRKIFKKQICEKETK